MTPATKTCPACDTAKPLDGYYALAHTRDGVGTYCKDCHKEKVRERYERVGATPEFKRGNWDSHMLRSYGLTREAFDRLLCAHQGRCAICATAPKRLHIDHDHASGRVRGLLCTTCNVGLGKLGDSVVGLERALDYLRG